MTVIYHIHGGVRPGMVSALQRAALHAADITIAVSGFVGESVREYARRLVIIPNPVSNYVLKQLNGISKTYAKKQLGLPPRALVIGSISDATPQKGLHVLIRAFHRVVSTESYGDTPLYLLLGGISSEGMGYEDYVKSLKNLIDTLGIRERVLMMGYTDNVATYLKATDIFVLASLDDPQYPAEAFGLVALEAMAAGCAVVASNVGGIPEVVRHDVSGVLVEPGNVDALASQITRILKDSPLRSRLSSNGRRIALDKFSEDSFREQLIAVILSSKRL